MFRNRKQLIKLLVYIPTQIIGDSCRSHLHSLNKYYIINISSRIVKRVHYNRYQGKADLKLDCYLPCNEINFLNELHPFFLFLISNRFSSTRSHYTLLSLISVLIQYLKSILHSYELFTHH